MKIFFRVLFSFLALFFLNISECRANDFIKLGEEKCAYLHPRIKLEDDFWYNDETFLESRKACYDLGIAYYYGKPEASVSVDKKKASEIFAKCMEYEDYGAQYMYGLMMIEGEGGIKKDIFKGLEIIKYAGNKENVEAQYKLATLFSDNKVVPKDDKEAFYWSLKAAKNGYVKSQYDVATRYELGQGVDMDMRQAIKWFGDAAQGGSAEAQYRLGMMFFMGDTLPQDYKMAYNLMEAAAKQNFALAQYFMGYMYDEGEGITKNTDKAINWYKKAAENGFNRAFLRLGEMEVVEYQVKLAKNYLLGLNDFQKDPSKSAYWLEKAAKNDDMDSQFKIGLYYLEGFGVNKSEEKAAIWFKAASLKGHEEAEEKLEDILFKREKEVFYEQNKELFEMAERNGDAAQYQLGQKYEEKYLAKDIKDFKDRDLREALEWYNKAADLGNVDALYRLGDAYFNGDIVEQEEESAIKFLKKAGEKGNYEAQKRLARYFEKRIGLDIKNKYTYTVLDDQAYWDALHWYEKAAKTSKSPEAYYRLGNFYYTHVPEKKGYEESLFNAWIWLEKAKQNGVENAYEPIKEIGRKIGRNFRIKENKMIETFVERLISETESDLATAERLGLRRYSRDEMSLSNLYYSYGVNLKCGYDKSITVGVGFAKYKNAVDQLVEKLSRSAGEEKLEAIKIEAEDFASKVICDTKEAYLSKRYLLKFADR